MLHPIVHDNKSKLWCGPAVIAIVTGASTNLIHRLAHERRATRSERKPVQGMSSAELCYIMERLGYRMVDAGLPGGDRVTVLQLWTGNVFERDLPVIAATADHWFLIHRGRYHDNVIPEGTGEVTRVSMGELVEEFMTWRLERTPTNLPGPKPRPPSQHPSMRLARSIASEFRIDIERQADIGAWYVHCPEEVDEVDDIHEGDHYCHSVDEVLARVRSYRDLVLHVREHGALC